MDRSLKLQHPPIYTPSPRLTDMPSRACPAPPLGHSTDTYDFKLLKKAHGKQSKTRADQWIIAAVQRASKWASKHQHIVHLPIAFAQVYVTCM